MSAEATIRAWMDTAVEAIRRAETAETALAATQEENRRLKAELAEFDEANRMMVKHADIRRAELDQLRAALANAAAAAYAEPHYLGPEGMERGTDGLLQPGSPYDRCRYDARKAIEALAPPISPRRAEHERD